MLSNSRLAGTRRISVIRSQYYWLLVKGLLCRLHAHSIELKRGRRDRFRGPATFTLRSILQLQLMSMSTQVLRECFSQVAAMDGFKKTAYTPLMDAPPGPESHDGDHQSHCSDHHAFSMGEPPQRKYSMFDLRSAQSQPGRAVYRPKKSRCARRWAPAAGRTRHADIRFFESHALDACMVLVLRVMRWLILHSSGDRQTLTLEKRQLIQVGGDMD